MKENLKRRKHKDNPYKLMNYEEEKEYLVEFKDGKGEIQRIHISKRIYEEMDTFEKLDLKELNEYDRHIEHSFLYEEQLMKRARKKQKSVESLVSEHIEIENIRKAIIDLPNSQKERIIDYYFYGMTQKEIANKYNISIRAVQYTLNTALRKLKQNLKK